MFGFEKSKSVLEFDKIVNDVASLCVSFTGRERLLNNKPFVDKDSLNEVLSQVNDMREVYLTDGGFPIWDFYDVRILLNKILPEQSYLEVQDLMNVQNFLELISEVLKFHKSIEEKYSHLRKITSQLIPDEHLLNQLKFTIEPSGRIFDNASKELKAIRKDIAGVNNEIHKRLDRILRKKAEFIQEEYITLRDGRLVVPVREFSVTKVPGIVHGQSSSGATYFVEPMPVVEFNNQMQKLLAAEHKEIIKILKRLSSMVKQSRELLLVNLNLLNDLDAIQAKARYANEYECIQPEISINFSWNLKNAKHPILLKMYSEKTVPLNLHAGDQFNELVISGPNAGGKTVALKTIGLLQLLFQSGFHIPVGEGTSIPICRQIFAVIGDEQSIEDDLSTFSSHIRLLNDVENNLQDESLVLIDEIGKGTDPDGGAALSIAFLEKLNQSGIVTFVTTHQNQLKAFAAETDGIENAAMQFDMKHLTPLFKLEMGIPGSSYTFEICKRFGLDESILDRAAQISGKETFKLDSLLADVVEKSQKYQDVANQLSIKESKLNSLIGLYEDQSKTLKQKRKKFEKEAADEAKKMLDGINREIESVIREIRESQADKQVVKRGREKLQKIRNELETITEEDHSPEIVDIKSLKAGQTVHSKQYGIKGTISKLLLNREEVEIMKDGLKITVPVSDLEIFDQHGQKVHHRENITLAPSVNVTNEIDLRGLMVEEAVREVETYLDSALLSEWDEVRIVHGKGTGSLRLAVHQYLSGLKSIKGYRLGKWGEGDTGVTVVNLK